MRSLAPGVICSGHCMFKVFIFVYVSCWEALKKGGCPVRNS